MEPCHAGNVIAVIGDVTLRGSGWRTGEVRFTSPEAVLEAHRAGDVPAVLKAAASAASGGKWVAGFVAYDAAQGLSSRLEVPGSTRDPLVWFGVYEGPTEASRRSALKSVVGEWEPAWTREEHLRRVEAIKESIRGGYTYQANLTMPMTASHEGDPTALFEQMVTAQPKSFAAHIEVGGAHIVSVSPELFLRMDRSSVTMRPMKGTAPRGRSAVEDELRRSELEASEKEQAGNVMIVDMIRNDLGRIAVTGSVEVPELFSAERYPTVWQLTSTITAELRPEIGLGDIFAATFPSGSVTGAPKESTMRLIARTESAPRGPYCGAIGYIRPGGAELEFSVAIRTGVVADGRLRYHVGGGITADSDADVEYDECLWKALVVTSTSHAPDLIETMRYEPGTGIELLPGHLQRLGASARYWDIPLDLEAVGDALSAVESARPIKVRLVLYRNGDIEVETEELDDRDEPVALHLAAGRVDPSEPQWFHKTLDRSRYPNPEEGEALMINLDGLVTETNISNLMVRFDGEWLTPSLGSGCLPGVYRARLLERGEVGEAEIALDDLEKADELAVTNAVRGWRKAVLIG